MSKAKDLENQTVELLLNYCRSKIADGEGEAALTALIIIISQGEDAVFEILNKAKFKAQDQYEQDRLAEAFSICTQLASSSSLLQERGDEDILVDAFKDGSSVVCQKCNALIPTKRADAHSRYWCVDSNEDDPNF